MVGAEGMLMDGRERMVEVGREGLLVVGKVVNWVGKVMLMAGRGSVSGWQREC